MAVNYSGLVTLKRFERITPYEFVIQEPIRDDWDNDVYKYSKEVPDLQQQERIYEEYAYLKAIWKEEYPAIDFDCNAFYLVDTKFLLDSGLFPESDWERIQNLIDEYAKEQYGIYVYFG